MLDHGGFDILPAMNDGDSREGHPLKFEVDLLDVVPDASGIVQSSGPCHVAHRCQPQEDSGPTKVLHAYV